MEDIDIRIREQGLDCLVDVLDPEACTEALGGSPICVDQTDERGKRRSSDKAGVVLGNPPTTNEGDIQFPASDGPRRDGSSS
jgi:hypothetical protein